MTLIVAWVSRDQDGPSTVYIASDSRLTQGAAIWDHGKKVYASRTATWIFGFCGAALIVSQLVSQMVDAIDAGFIPPQQRPDDGWEACRRYLESGLAGGTAFVGCQPSYVIGFRRLDNGHFDGGYFTIRTELKVDFTHLRMDPNMKGSSIVKVLGTGAEVFGEIEAETREKNFRQCVSRVFFAAVCRAISRKCVTTVGGVPQLVSLRENGGGMTIPVFMGGKLWHQGIGVDSGTYTGDCYDDHFQQIDPQTLVLKVGAQRQVVR